MELPAGLSPEMSSWIQAQIAMSNASNAATLRAEINKVDDWANGVFVALKDVLLPLLTDHPLTAYDIGPQWRKAAEQFERIEQGHPPADTDETLEFLEARKMLYRVFELLGVWRKAAVASVQKPARRA